MAAVITAALRNYSRAVGVNRLLLSNPCLSSLNGLPGGLQRTSDQKSTDLILANKNARPFSLKTKSLAEAQSGKPMHDHTRLWSMERGLSFALAGIVPAAFIFPSPVMDNILALAVTLHVHWGIETIVVDYLRPKIVGPTVASIGVALVYLISAFTLGGLFYFNYSDVGIVNAVKMLWKL